MTDGTVVDVAGVLAAVREIAAAQITPGAAKSQPHGARFPRDRARRARRGRRARPPRRPTRRRRRRAPALVEACEAVGTASASSAIVYLMHFVTAATIAAAAASGRSCCAMATARRSGRSPSASAAPARTSTPELRGRAPTTARCGSAGARVRHFRRPRRRHARPAPGRRGDGGLLRGARDAAGVRFEGPGRVSDGGQLERRDGARRRRVDGDADRRGRRRRPGLRRRRATSWPGSPPSTSASRRPRRPRRSRTRPRAATRTAPARRAPDDPAPARRHGPRRPRHTGLVARRPLGEAGDPAALVALMEAKVPPANAAEVTGSRSRSAARRTPSLPMSVTCGTRARAR